MDASLPCADSQSQPALTDSQTLDFDSVVHSPTVDKLSAQEPGTETAHCLSDTTDKSTLHVSADPHSLKALSSIQNVSEQFSLSSEASPTDDNFRVQRCLSQSGRKSPLIPQLCQDLILPQPESASSPLMEGHTPPESFGAVSLTLEGLMELSVTVPYSSPSFSSENKPPLLRSLSPQSDSSDSDTAVAPLSDLYIFESDTQDFILSPSIAPGEIKCSEYQPLSQTSGEQVNHNCDKHVLMCDSSDVTGCHHSSCEEQSTENNEPDVSEHLGLRTPAVNACEAYFMSLNDERQRKAEVTGATPPRGNSPMEVWQDAHQYLAGDDTEDRDVLDKMHHSVIQEALAPASHLSCSPRETQVSHYNPEGSKGIGWTGDDTKGWGPPIERWSSVDSWASALSDWTGIIAAPSEDFTSAFSEIGAEIDALTQALSEVNTHTEAETVKEGHNLETTAKAQMGVQDQPLSTQNISESSIHSGQGCLSLCLDSTGLEPHHTEGAESLCDPTPTTQGDKCSPSRGAPGTMVAFSGENTADATVVTLMSGSTSADLDLSPFDECAESQDTESFISDEKTPVVLSIIEDTDLDPPTDLITKEPIGDRLCEVTDEHRLVQLGSVAEPEAKLSCGRFEVNRDENKSITDCSVLTPDALTDSNVPGGDTQPSLHFNADNRVSIDTLPDLDRARQVEAQRASPTFIMPLAPVSIGPSLNCRTSSSLEGDQICLKGSLNNNSCNQVRQSALLPTSDGITNKASLEGGEELIHEKQNTTKTAERSSPEGLQGLKTSDTVDSFFSRKTIFEEIDDFNRELENFIPIPAENFFISKEKHIACITLDIYDPFVSKPVKPKAIKSEKVDLTHKKTEKMPHKTHKNTSEGKTRSKKDKSSGHHHFTQPSKKQESKCHRVSAQQTSNQQDTHPTIGENHSSENSQSGLEAKEATLVIEAGVVTEKATSKPHGKKKKKHGQNTAPGEPLAEVENGAKSKTAKGRIELFESKLGAKAGKAQKESEQPDVAEIKSQQQSEAKASEGEEPPHPTDSKGHQPKNFTSPLNDDVVKRRRLSEDKFGKIVSILESKLPKSDVSAKGKEAELKTDVGGTRKKAYSEVVKQRIPPKEEPKVVKPIQAVAVSGDPQSLCLWCQFAAVTSAYTVTWSREGTVLAEMKRSAGDESRVSLTISNASHKDLGKYLCQLSSLHGSVSLDYLLTYEVLSEIVIPLAPKTVSSDPVEVSSEEEDAHFSRLLFKDDFLSDQYFGDSHPISMITEKEHFGEGMHRRAFRTKLHAGQIPLLLPGHSCVLKVHNAISYGTKNNEELVQKNFTLAVEECQVQNTAREYIKAYTAAAQSTEAFGDIPEIIPIYLIHRPSNDIPYATLEEELIGDFVKYSVKDGKEINLMRRDSEAGQKCCAFQHWVYQKTDGNLLVTDMQGVGMKLTDVGIATCKKGYKGFKGNCGTSFIDQFKALHLCNVYCEMLGLKSLQPKAKKPASAPKPKSQSSTAPKKKTFGPVVKGKS
ncbi:alpha-protein kinase 2 [Oreochromis aureus]|uniref:non-specific serine/threonine protein kinase n=1 Tax=Oreochromis aureus TaxID=47969 RepID=A0A668VCR9_OREAU|nr:alpha-protein kinase 2 [Oreochromis aureus]